jgi:hypothetical protein
MNGTVLTISPSERLIEKSHMAKFPCCSPLPAELASAAEKSPPRDGANGKS